MEKLRIYPLVSVAKFLQEYKPPINAKKLKNIYSRAREKAGDKNWVAGGAVLRDIFRDRALEEAFVQKAHSAAFREEWKKFYNIARVTLGRPSRKKRR